MVRQTVFMDGRLDENVLGLKPTELKVLNAWAAVDARCPWCLRPGRLRDFAKVLLDRSFSRGRVVCPGCGCEMAVRTVVQVANMSAEEYAFYLWENVFLWRNYEKVRWNDLKDRMYGWPRVARDTFWDVYHFFKMFDDRSEALEHKDHWRTYPWVPEDEAEGDGFDWKPMEEIE